MPVYLKWFSTIAVAAALACIFFPGKAGTYFFTQQMFVSFTMFTEALSLLSQLYHMRMSRGLEGLNSQYLAALAVSRLSRIYFWYTMSSKLNTFWYLIAADSIHTVLVVAFALVFYSTAKQQKSGSVLG